MNQVSRISVVSDAEAARMVSAETLADLAERITASPYRQTPTVRSRSRTWRLLIVIPVAAAFAVALLIVTSLFRPGEKVGPVPVGPAKARAAALSFARHGGYIDVIVRNPMASQARYSAEFAAHHMHITIKMIAASPSVVGTLVYESANPRSGITIIRSRHACYTPGGGWGRCIVGVRVPVGYHGHAAFVFGRPARPGEQYQTAGSVDRARRGHARAALRWTHGSGRSRDAAPAARDRPGLPQGHGHTHPPRQGPANLVCI